MPVIICAHIGFGRVNSLNLNICPFEKVNFVRLVMLHNLVVYIVEIFKIIMLHLKLLINQITNYY